MRTVLLALGTFLIKASLRELPDGDKLGLRVVALLLFLLEQAAAYTTNTVDDELVKHVREHLDGTALQGEAVDISRGARATVGRA